MPGHIMKRRAELPVSNDELPRGLNAVHTEHTGGFFSDLDDDEPAHPPFAKSDAPAGIYTFEPWLGCLWGKRCGFCYVPNASVRHYPGGKPGYWHQKWGSWLLYKQEIASRLRSELLDASGRTRPR